MASAGEYNYRLGSERINEITVNVTIPRSFHVRFWVGLWLVKLGLWIVPVRSKVKTTNEGNSQ